MGAPQGTNDHSSGTRVDNAAEDLGGDTVLTTTADVESAGRSCMAILILAVVILLLLCVWIGIRSTGAGQ